MKRTVGQKRKAKTVLPFRVDRMCGHKLTDQVIDGLRGAILNGHWKMGDILPSRGAMSRAIGVSENIVRAALMRLSAEKLILPRAGTGCVVLRRTNRKIRGHVLHVLAEDSGSYNTSVFASGLSGGLHDFGIRCTSVCVPSRGDGRPDFSWLKAELLQVPDVAVVESNSRMAPGVVPILEKSGIPYVMIQSRSFRCGGHCLAAIPYETGPAVEDFVRDCHAARIWSVGIVCFGEDSFIDPQPALTRVGIAVEKLVVQDNPDLEVVQRQVALLMADRLRRGSLCDLIFFSDDYLALGAVPILLERGMRIPEDVKVVSQSNSGFGPVFPKTLAQIRFDFRDYASEIVHELIDWFKSGRFASDYKIVPRYVRGETFPV